MPNNPFIPEPSRPDRLANGVIVAGLAVAVALASGALAMQLKPSLMPDALPELVGSVLEGFRTESVVARADEPECRATTRILHTDAGELLRVSRFVACDADGDHAPIAYVERDVDCTRDDIGCLVALSEIEVPIAGDLAVAAFDPSRREAR